MMRRATSFVGLTFLRLIEYSVLDPDRSSINRILSTPVVLTIRFGTRHVDVGGPRGWLTD